MLAVLSANIIFAFVVNYFTLPYRFPDLGISGLAVLSNYVFGISTMPLVRGVILLRMSCKSGIQPLASSHR